MAKARTMADTEITITANGPASDGTTRVPASDRRSDPPKPTVIVEAQDKAPARRIVRRPARTRDAAEGVEASRNAAEIAGVRAAEMRAANAQNDATKARGETVRAVTTLVAERVVGAQRDVESATAAKELALGQLRMAREAGDFETEQKAIDAISLANYNIEESKKRLATAQGEQERLKSAPAPEAQPENGPSAASRAWMAAHPMIDTDDEYYASAAAADALAAKRGIRRGSQEYVDFVDQRLEAEYGPGHGVPATHGMQAEEDDERIEHYSPSRGGGGSRGMVNQDERGTGSRVQTEIGTITVRHGADGPIYSFPNNETLADFEAGAKACGMSLPDYTKDMVKIAQEVANGKNPGLYREEGVKTYR